VLPISVEKQPCVISVTEHRTGSAMLSFSVCEGERHENNLRGDGSCLRVHDRHGRDHDHCPDRVMSELLMFLARGFALFAGGAGAGLSRSTVERPRRRREIKANGRTGTMVRYVAFVGLGCAFLAVLWMTAQTHRLYAQTPTAMLATGALR
jgi:hypothetical protein